MPGQSEAHIPPIMPRRPSIAERPLEVLPVIDSTERYQRSIQAAALALADGDRLAAERELRTAIKALEGVEGAELQLTPVLVRLATLKQEDGQPEEAIPLLARALAISEQHVGEEHPDLVILLNDLSRLHLKQAAHEEAEPLLLRLLAIKRSKGDEHPEVATVLASLAAVRQALGRHEDAEQLWRRVLEIRERTLAPNHFAIATALEHLGETCAARAKVREAIRHFQRALMIRELTLGVDHASLRSARERIADLQLQAEESLEPDDAPPSPADPRRLSSGESLGLALASRAFTPTPRPELRPTVARPAVPLAGIEENGHKLPSALALATAAQPPATHKPAAQPAVAQQPTEAVSYLNVLMDIKDELDDTLEPSAPAAASAGLAASARVFFRQRRSVVLAAAGVLALPLAALAVTQARSGRSTGWVEQSSFGPGAPTRDSLSMAIAAFPDLSARPLSAGGEVHKDSADTPAGTTSTANAPRRAPEPRSSVVRVADPEPSILVPEGRPPVMRLDSVVRAISAPVPMIGEAFDVRLASSLRGAQRETAAGLGMVSAPQRARMVGALPTPKFPDQLAQRGIGGDVVVRFDVDTLGRPVMSTFTVVSSPHGLLTAAVRRVIPDMRFEPARTPAPDSRPTVDAVEIEFQFAARIR